MQPAELSPIWPCFFPKYVVQWIDTPFRLMAYDHLSRVIIPVRGFTRMYFALMILLSMILAGCEDLSTVVYDQPSPEC